jgi:hypothetical protein
LMHQADFTAISELLHVPSRTCHPEPTALVILREPRRLKDLRSRSIDSSLRSE